MEIIRNVSNHNGNKLEFTNRRKFWKVTNTWILNNTSLSNQCVKEEINKERRKYVERNENENTTYRNLCDSVKALLRGKLIAGTKEIAKQQGKSVEPNADSWERSTKLINFNGLTKKIKEGRGGKWRDDKLLNSGMKKETSSPTSRHKKD